MFTRSILIPSLIVCAIAAPILFSQAKQGTPPVDSPDDFARQFDVNNANPPWGPPAQRLPQGGPGLQTQSANYQTARNGNPIFYQANADGNPAKIPTTANQPGIILPSFPQPSRANNGMPITTVPGPMSFERTQDLTPTLTPFSKMNPEFGAGQTLIFPGDAYGPDFTAPPLEFMPVTSFEEIFRFDVTPEWIMNRWERVSTSPGDDGLHGLRVALVTGTNAWDLHGSLTYYFDGQQKPQRITFRGWAGDGKQLTNILMQKFGFQSQPTHWAGFYLARKRRVTTGGILMQHPTVIYRNNPIQQIAVVMEINNPQSNFALSNEFESLIAGSQHVY